VERKARIIATVINDVVYDQRMIRICSSLSQHYDVELWGRRLSAIQDEKRPYKTKRLKMFFKSGPAFYLEYNIRIFIRLLIQPFDVVHSVDLDTLSAGFWASKLKGKKLVYDSHELFTEVPELRHTPVKRNIWLALESFYLTRIKYAFTVGQSIADYYNQTYKPCFKVLRNCPVLKVNKDKKLETENEVFFLYQGALNEGRGLEAAIEAMKSVDASLWIAGRGDIEEKLYALVTAINVKDKVKFLGMIKPADLPALTQKAYAGVNVSENLGKSYYLSLNNKFFDYIHAEIPAITNDFPEYKKLNKEVETSLLCSANADEIAEAMNTLLEDKDLRNKLKENCATAAKKWCWQEEEKELFALYEQVIG
jgi:glycosyltransferase involved in cell wall biosynthesis